MTEMAKLFKFDSQYDEEALAFFAADANRLGMPEAEVIDFLAYKGKNLRKEDNYDA